MSREDLKRVRLELIANHTVEEALMEELEKRNVGQRYTVIRTVEGAGTSGSRMGDGVWPEENFLMILYASQEEAEVIASAVREVKSLYPIEGIKLYSTPAHELV